MLRLSNDSFLVFFPEKSSASTLKFRNISINRVNRALPDFYFYNFTQRYQHTVVLSFTSDIPQKAAEPGLGQLRDGSFLKSAKRKPESVSRHAIRARTIR